MSFTVSVVIKALNEEDKISVCIESVLRALGGYDHEVILADSISTDKTVEIASRYPISIVQLESESDQSCGAGAQLGYQYARGDYILLVDGDMELSEDFVPRAISLLEADRKLAGVSGLIIDKTVMTLDERHRASVYSKIINPLDVDSLGGGGLYRRSCIESVRYFSHPGLAACEELELGLRLKAAGFKLKRIPNVFCFHRGHRESAFESLKRKWKCGRMASVGVLIKCSYGRPWFWSACKSSWYVFVFPAVLAIGLALWSISGSVYGGFLAFLSIWGLLVVVQSVRKRSISQAFWLVASWWVFFFASVGPLLSKAKNPASDLRSKIIKISNPVIYPGNDRPQK